MKAAKYAVFVINLLVWALGLAVLGFSIFLRVYDVSDYFQQMPNASSIYDFYKTLYILMAAGGMMVVVGFLGCCGALRESPCLLGTYFTLLFFIVAAEIAALSYYGMRKNEIEEEIDRLFRDAVSSYNMDASSNPGTKELVVDRIQSILRCCGVDGPSSYYASSGSSSKLPASCCTTLSSTSCDMANKADVYQGGCTAALDRWFSGHIYAMIGIIVGTVILQLICMVLSIVFCCHLRQQKFYV